MLSEALNSKRVGWEWDEHNGIRKFIGAEVQVESDLLSEQVIQICNRKIILSDMINTTD